nr:IQ motif, EF-hand binding site [Ipomoea trifida]
MTQRANGSLPSLQSIKSLPLDARFVQSGSLKKPDVVNQKGYRMASDMVADNGEFFAEVNGISNEDNDESPYRSFSFSANERPSAVDDDLNVTTYPSRSVAPTSAESKWSDTKFYAAKKVRSWLQLPDGNWQLVTIISTSGTESVISFSDGRVQNVKSENLLPANPDILDGVDDLMQLSYLNEPSVLYNLQYRYNKDMIYSKAGPVLVAINPFKNVPLYGNDDVEAYKRKSSDSPHVYAITDTAMREMVRDEVNQSIIISGESGAGKTETAKIAMQYLAALGGGSGIEYEILKTNPILEAFGNAKTLRNDNSSRFGKLIEIHFSETGKISGANIQTFLLEKEALDVVHVSKEDQESVFSMLAAVLWLGNISFTVIDSENHVEPVDDEGLITVATLLGCEAIETRDALAKSIYSCLFDWLVEQINKSLAVGKRRTGRSISILDIYGFESFERNSFEQFCINYANERLQQHFNRHLFKLEQEEYIQDGIDWTKVDFDDNKDCLNLFEKGEIIDTDVRTKIFMFSVKTLFVLFVVQYEKPLGLLSLLDEESTFPNGTDMTFANKLKQHLNSNPCFKGDREKSFTVCHYAGEVTYDAFGFLEKNRDLLHLDSIQLLSSCKCHLPQIFASNMLTQSEKPVVGPLYKSGGADSQKLSVATKFKGQLFQLMQRLESTTPHFIRCIKPNSFQSPGKYDQGLVLQQLRCCGVLEVVRISRSGFPTRMSHQKFARRYGFLLLDHVASQDPLSVSVAILHQFNILPDMYQVGYTKLFFRTGQVGVLEDTRNRTLRGILRVQSCFRGHQARTYLKQLKRGVTTLQSFIRGWLVRRCSGDIGLLQFGGKKGNECEEVLVKSSFLSELQRRVLRAEAALREKEEENDILHQRLQQYENRWSEYELKMKSMEEVWQKQMRSLQSSLSIAKKSLALDDMERNSDASVNTMSDDRESIQLGIEAGSNRNNRDSSSGVRPMSAGLSVISRLAEEFEQRSQVFGDDAKFLVEVKSGQVDANLNPDHELRRLKQMFEAWKKDYGTRLRETKVILHKLQGNDELVNDKMRKKWWGKRNNSSRFN